MYIPMFVIILALIIWVIYSTYRYEKISRIGNDMARSYSEVVKHLISYQLHGIQDKKKRKKQIELCAKAILDACGMTITTRSLLSTTDILSMGEIFRRSFTLRDKLTCPIYEFKPEYDKELDKIEKEIVKDIEIWFGDSAE